MYVQNTYIIPLLHSPQLCGMSMKYAEQGIFSGLCEQFTIAWSVTVIHIVQSKLYLCLGQIH